MRSEAARRVLERLKGPVATIIVPFNQDYSVDHSALRDWVDFLASRGVPILIFTYGSTAMSVLEALRAGDIEATVVQPVYLEPFPTWELEEYAATDVIVVEQSCSGQFAMLLNEKAQIRPRTVIRKYDGRPFEPRELAQELKEVI